MRPYLLFVSGITGIVGLSLTPATSLITITLVFLASFLSYGFGQALTDCFQIDTDSLSAPYRPLTQGTIGTNHVLTVSVIGLGLCISVFAIHNPVNLIMGIIAGAGLATYTPFKRKWWAGPFYNAWIVLALCIIAFFAGARTVMVFSTPVVWTLLAVFFGYANFVLTGYFKDIEADRTTGYNTFPVVFGRKAAAWVSDAFAVLTVVFAGLAIINALPLGGRPAAPVPAIGFALSGLLTSVTAQVRIHSVKREDEAHQAISPVVHSYTLLLTGIASCHKPEWGVPLLIFYLSFNLVLKLRPAKDQI
jgi:4-hydroxybenzoate polyprenyltransferase